MNTEVCLKRYCPGEGFGRNILDYFFKAEQTFIVESGWIDLVALEPGQIGNDWVLSTWTFEDLDHALIFKLKFA